MFERREYTEADHERWKDDPPLVSPKFVVNNPPYDYVEHIRSALALNVPELADLYGRTLPYKLAIVAGSPSLNPDEIREFKRVGHVIACGSVHDHLIRNDVVPDHALFVDPFPAMSKVFNLPHDQVNYFMSSVCHPELFKKLKGKKIFLFHTWIDQPEVLELLGNRFAMSGGGSCTVRAYLIALALGYRDIHFYGFDCSFPEGSKTQHAYDMPEEQISEEAAITVLETGKRFSTTAGFLVQANDFLNCHSALAKHNVTIHGDGLVADLFKTHCSRA